MDSTELRLILLGLGIILVVGIYAWEKSKRQRRSTRERLAAVSARPKRQQRKKFGDHFARRQTEQEATPEIRERQEPSLGGTPVTETAEVVEEPPPPPPPAEPPEPKLDAMETSSPSETPPEVLAIHVVARVGSSFSGDAIMSSVRGLDMVPGDMEIFHRIDDESGQTVFSMANMVKPGTFPFSAMSDFSTPGLVLFAQLPGPRHGLVLFDELLAVGDRLAALLDGRVQDEKRTPLTPDKIDAIRNRLLGTH